MTAKKDTLRTLLAVIAGIAAAKVLTVLTHELLFLCANFPPPLEPMFETRPLLLSLSFHSFYAVLSAMLTARIAGNRARKAVFILGTKEAVLWLAGTVLLWKDAAPWFNLSKAILGIPLAMLGGRIYLYFHVKSYTPTRLPD